MDAVTLKLLGALDPAGGSSPLGGAAGVDNSAVDSGVVDGAGGSGGFGKMLEGAIGKLEGSLSDASAASQSLATGQAQDVAQVAMTVERSALELQLAAQVRNKAVEAYQDLYRMQI
jgi:flagellar hook-basal body complex protein FliE